jgi:dihydrofolate reductase
MNRPLISIIAAHDDRLGIGKDNKLPWYIPEDLRRFKRLTLDHPVIMGRKTFESIGKPLPERTNIIITRNANYQANGCIICTSLEQAIQKATEIDQNEIFIIGGASVYKQALPFAGKLYITKVNGVYDCDTFFPNYEKRKFIKIKRSKKKQKGNYIYRFILIQTKP